LEIKTVIHLTITGNTPSKKNQKQIIYVRGKPLIIPSKRHKEWHTQAIAQLYGIKPVVSQISAIEVILYPPDKRLFDISNRAETLLDLLVDAHIIEDDNYKIVPKLITEFGEIDRENPRAEITIYEQIRTKETETPQGV
jgi:crossover junction endodeoxyribonuclease RusA